MNVKAQNLRFAENSLPEGWVLTELREVLEVHYGKGLTKSVRNETGAVPVYGSNGKVGYHDVALVTGPCIIIGRKGAAGAVHFSAENCWPIDTTYYTRPPDELSVKYMFYLLGSLNLEELDRSTAIPGLNRDDLYAQQVPIPPLPEQHRIVAEIETQFTRLDAGVVALKRVQAKLRRYKASVLKAACEGRLVPTEAELARVEGREYEPASALLARILAERRAQWERANPGKRYVEPKGVDGAGSADLPEGWVWASMDQLIAEFRSGSTAVPQDDPTDFPILRSSSVRPKHVDLGDVRFLQEAMNSVPDNFLEENDLLFTRLSGSLDYVGNCAMVRRIGERRIQYPDRLFRAKLCLGELGRYVESYFASPPVRKEIMAKAKSTAGHQRISMGAIRDQLIALPPLAEQHRIVAEVERRLSVVQEVESTVAANLRRAERLRQSILKQAFAGRLVGA